MARSFDAKWKSEDGWLSDAERHAKDWKPRGFPEACDADITKHKVSVLYRAFNCLL